MLPTSCMLQFNVIQVGTRKAANMPLHNHINTKCEASDISVGGISQIGREANLLSDLVSQQRLQNVSANETTSFQICTTQPNKQEMSLTGLLKIVKQIWELRFLQFPILSTIVGYASIPHFFPLGRPGSQGLLIFPSVNGKIVSGWLGVTQ